VAGHRSLFAALDRSDRELPGTRRWIWRIFEIDSGGNCLQVAIVSFGVGSDTIECGSAAAPSVYTSVAAFDAWIRSVMDGR